MKPAKILLHPGLLLFVIILLIGASAYSYWQYDQSQNELKQYRVELEELRKFKEDPRAAAANETRKIIDQVGQLVALPENETPTVATITDVEKLKEQPFFANAQNGDKILIYTGVRKAILYRPTVNKVIEVAPVNVTQPQPTPAEGAEGGEPTGVITPTGALTPTTMLSPTATPTQGSEEEVTPTPLVETE